MRVWIARLAFGASLLLSLTAVALWATGFREGIITRVAGVELRLDPGVFGVKRVYEYGPRMIDEDWSKPLRAAQLRTLPRHDYGFWGLTYTLGEERHGDDDEPLVHPRIARYWMVGLPMWLFALLFALPLIRWAIAWPRRRRASRIEHGLCPACGYDLRASPGRCPECGTLVPDRDSSGKQNTRQLTPSAR